MPTTKFLPKKKWTFLGWPYVASKVKIQVQYPQNYNKKVKYRIIGIIPYWGKIKGNEFKVLTVVAAAILLKADKDVTVAYSIEPLWASPHGEQGGIGNPNFPN